MDLLNPFIYIKLAQNICDTVVSHSQAMPINMEGTVNWLHKTSDTAHHAYVIHIIFSIISTIETSVG